LGRRLSSTGLFFHSGHVAVLHLHSFPTRRSSDLLSKLPAASRIALADINGWPEAPSSPLQAGAPPGFWGCCGACPLLPGLKRLLDRKSTRLNSSHSQISYAVFCLKKKTESRILTH